MTFVYNKSRLLNHIGILGKGIPIMLLLCPTNTCNCNCSNCIFYGVNNKYRETDGFVPEDELNIDDIISLLYRFVSVGGRSVELTGGGEPTCHQHFEDMIYCIENLGLDWGVITNGLLVDRIVGNPAWIRISIDAGSEKVWEVTHRKRIDFDQYIKSIESLIKRMKNTVVGGSFLIQKENYADIASGASLAKQLGLKYLRYTYVRTGQKASYFDSFAKEMIELQEKTEQKFGDFVKFQRERIDTMEKPMHTIERCYYSEHVLNVCADGYVYPCCELDYIKEYRLGKMLDPSILIRIMNTENCPNCFMDRKNEDIQELIMHANFL